MILFFLLRPHHAEQLVKKGDVPSPPVPEEGSPTPAITIPPSAAPMIPAGTPQDVSPTPASSAAPSFRARMAFNWIPVRSGRGRPKALGRPTPAGYKRSIGQSKQTVVSPFSGPWSDAGAITASNGKMKWFSNNNPNSPGRPRLRVQWPK